MNMRVTFSFPNPFAGTLFGGVVGPAVGIVFLHIEVPWVLIFLPEF